MPGMRRAVASGIRSRGRVLRPAGRSARPGGVPRPVLAGAVAACMLLVAGPAALAGTDGGPGPMWHLQSPPVPAGSIGSDLGGVSCAVASACATVGGYELTGGVFDSVAEIWTGRSWVISGTPDPAASDLTSVSCATARLCVAVGDVLSGDDLVPLAERWNGSTWSAQRPPNPAGATRSFLTGVSCPSSRACTAVGFSGSGSQRTIAEHWNGSRWLAEHPVTPRGHALDQFNSVSCASDTACMAVGSFASGMFTESNHGATWTMRKVGLPAGGSDGYLSAVSCTAADQCSAVGDYFNGARQVPLAERWNGRHWAIEHVPAPRAGAPGVLASVSCAGPMSCVAAGTSGKSANQDKLLVERWSDGTWASQVTPSPASASSDSFLGVSCPSVFVCEAVGFLTTSDGTEVVLAERYS
jgi:hypothetical protein